MLCIGLSRLSMYRVPAAPAAVLAQFDAVRRVPLGLRRLVVPPLAVGASEGDRVSYSGCQLQTLLVACVETTGRQSLPAGCPIVATKRPGGRGPAPVAPMRRGRAACLLPSGGA